MSVKQQSTTYVPPATTFILGRPGASYGQQPLKNKHWNALKEGVQGGQARVPNGYIDKGRSNGGNEYSRRNTYNGNARRNGSRRNDEQNGVANRMQSKEGERPVNNERLPNARNSVRREGGEKKYPQQQPQQNRNGHRDTEDKIVMQKDQNYYATPDYSNVFGEADRNNGTEGKRNSILNGSTKSGTNSDRQPQQQRESAAGLLPWQQASLDEYDDYDWQRKNENGGKTAASDAKDRRRRGSSVYDPEGAKRRTEGIEKRQYNANENRNGPQHSKSYNNGSRREGSERRKGENGEHGRQPNANRSIRGDVNGDKRRLSNGQRNGAVEHPSDVPDDHENGTESRRDNRNAKSIRKQSYPEKIKGNGTRGHEADGSDSIDMSKVNGKLRRENPEKSATDQDDFNPAEDEIGARTSDQQNDSGRASDNEKNESGLEDEKKALLKKEEEGLFGILRKCTPKFATKVLDAIEKEKVECMFCLDQFSEKYKEHLDKKKQPVFTSYSCENGDADDNSFKASMNKLRNLVGGYYSKACTEMEAFVETVDDMLEEKKPEEDGKWSTVEGQHGTRCLPQCDNQIEDHTIYVCSHCFNDVVNRDAYVNVKYFDAEYGCCKPKIVSRSFENRPAFCERMLASMSEKRRACFLKRIGKKHQMKSGVHCISKIPSMDKEAEGNQTEAAQCSVTPDNET